MAVVAVVTTYRVLMLYMVKQAYVICCEEYEYFTAKTEVKKVTFKWLLYIVIQPGAAPDMEKCYSQ